MSDSTISPARAFCGLFCSISSLPTHVHSCGSGVLLGLRLLAPKVLPLLLGKSFRDGVFSTFSLGVGVLDLPERVRGALGLVRLSCFCRFPTDALRVLRLTTFLGGSVPVLAFCFRLVLAITSAELRLKARKSSNTQGVKKINALNFFLEV